MAYSIEFRLASKNGWFTPDEARRYYGRYNREGITWHWWGDGTGASNHDNIVNYMLQGAENGIKSVNYVLSDNKITLLVGPDNVAWASQSGNPVSVSVELQPTLAAEGYKKAGWLASELAGRYGGDRSYYPHKYWFPTECPGTISLDRIRQEEDKWQRGEYDAQPVPQPIPTPTPPPPAPSATLVWEQWKEGVRRYVFNKDANLWNFNSTTWNMQVIKSFKKGEFFDVYGQVTNTSLSSKPVYYLTEYSYKNGLTNGVNPADLDVYVAPVPVPPSPPPDPEPIPVPPQQPEWVTNLRDIDDTHFWIIEECDLIDITTGLPSTGKYARHFTKDESFVASAVTKANGMEYRITDYSFKAGIFNGVPISKLTLTAPGIPDIPPVPNFEQRLSVLEALVAKIIAILKGLQFWKD